MMAPLQRHRSMALRKELRQSTTTMEALDVSERKRSASRVLQASKEKTSAEYTAHMSQTARMRWGMLRAVVKGGMLGTAAKNSKAVAGDNRARERTLLLAAAAAQHKQQQLRNRVVALSQALQAMTAERDEARGELAEVNKQLGQEVTRRMAEASRAERYNQQLHTTGHYKAKWHMQRTYSSCTALIQQQKWMMRDLAERMRKMRDTLGEDFTTLLGHFGEIVSGTARIVQAAEDAAGAHLQPSQNRARSRSRRMSTTHSGVADEQHSFADLVSAMRCGSSGLLSGQGRKSVPMSEIHRASAVRHGVLTRYSPSVAPSNGQQLPSLRMRSSPKLRSPRGPSPDGRSPRFSPSASPVHQGSHGDGSVALRSSPQFSPMAGPASTGDASPRNRTSPSEGFPTPPLMSQRAARATTSSSSLNSPAWVQQQQQLQMERQSMRGARPAGTQSPSQVVSSPRRHAGSVAAAQPGSPRRPQSRPSPSPRPYKPEGSGSLPQLLPQSVGVGAQEQRAGRPQCAPADLASWHAPGPEGSTSPPPRPPPPLAPGRRPARPAPRRRSSSSRALSPKQPAVELKLPGLGPTGATTRRSVSKSTSAAERTEAAEADSAQEAAAEDRLQVEQSAVADLRQAMSHLSGEKDAASAAPLPPAVVHANLSELNAICDSEAVAADATHAALEHLAQRGPPGAAAALRRDRQLMREDGRLRGAAAKIKDRLRNMTRSFPRGSACTIRMEVLVEKAQRRWAARRLQIAEERRKLLEPLIQYEALSAEEKAEAAALPVGSLQPLRPRGLGAVCSLSPVRTQTASSEARAAARFPVPPRAASPGGSAAHCVRPRRDPDLCPEAHGLGSGAASRSGESHANSHPDTGLKAGATVGIKQVLNADLVTQASHATLCSRGFHAGHRAPGSAH
eukprot:TRINITY_DN9743_c0_g1_i2.p1 TRINITY_DN9743_c0_g1~~TRINITY_DN9743_c0_g1_i2.p1  ORF type:complete len:945 (+),score=225.58 TRINITY_DN9743_c0_g1_i2:119-2836(+)